jgi:hypothetical protein
MRLLGQTTVNERHENVHEIDSSFALLAVDRSAIRERSIYAQKKMMLCERKQNISLCHAQILVRFKLQISPDTARRIQTDIGTGQKRR